MSNYIDGFAFPISKIHLNDYKRIAGTVAEIWKEHGALSYFEYVGDDLKMEGTRSFPETLNAGGDDAIVFGWVVFESKEARDVIHQKVSTDPRMADLIAPLIDPSNMIFDARKMACGGFQPLIP